MKKVDITLIVLTFLIFFNMLLATNTPSFAQSLQYGQLNKINLSAEYTFTADILGDGVKQTFTVTKDMTRRSKYILTVSQQSNILKTFNVVGSFLAKEGDGVRYWYIAYLRDSGIPDIIYFFIESME